MTKQAAAKAKSPTQTAAAYSPVWGRCRFCKQSAAQSAMVKYGVRHHAHAVCLYQHRGIEAIDELHTWQLRHLPIVAMRGAGVTLAQVRGWQARIAAEDAELAERYSTRASDEDGASEDEWRARALEALDRRLRRVALRPVVDHTDLRGVHAPRALQAAARQPSRRWRGEPARVQGRRRQVDSCLQRNKPCDGYRPEHSGTMVALRRLPEVRSQSRPALHGDRRSVLVALAPDDQAPAPRPPYNQHDSRDVDYEP